MGTISIDGRPVINLADENEALAGDMTGFKNPMECEDQAHDKQVNGIQEVIEVVGRDKEQRFKHVLIRIAYTIPSLSPLYD